MCKDTSHVEKIACIEVQNEANDFEKLLSDAIESKKAILSFKSCKPSISEPVKSDNNNTTDKGNSTDNSVPNTNGSGSNNTVPIPIPIENNNVTAPPASEPVQADIPADQVKIPPVPANNNNSTLKEPQTGNPSPPETETDSSSFWTFFMINGVLLIASLWFVRYRKRKVMNAVYRRVNSN